MHWQHVLATPDECFHHTLAASAGGAALPSLCKAVQYFRDHWQNTGNRHTVCMSIVWSSLTCIIDNGGNLLGGGSADGTLCLLPHYHANEISARLHSKLCISGTGYAANFDKGLLGGFCPAEKLESTAEPAACSPL